MRIEDSRELQDLIADYVERFGWWDVLWEISKALRSQHEKMEEKRKPGNFTDAAYHVDNAARAIEGQR